MKKLLLLLLMLTFAGCAAQHPQQPIITKVVAKVITTISDEVVIQSQGSKISYTIPTLGDGELREGSEYVFWLEVIPSERDNKQAVLVAYELTSWQTRKNQDDIARSLSGRRIIDKVKAAL